MNSMKGKYKNNTLEIKHTNDAGCVHHIVLDGKPLGVLLKEAFELLDRPKIDVDKEPIDDTMKTALKGFV